jgi:two-component system repressor protein LuxO
VSLRVVVIDDEVAVCDLLGKVLGRAGYEVHVATSGEAGLALLEQHPVDCLVVDKLLPRMNGLEVMARVRQRWPGVAVVMMTAHPEPFTLAAERPEVVLAKPFRDLAALEEAVQQALDARRPQGQGPLTQLKERVAAVVAEIAPGRRKRDE